MITSSPTLAAMGMGVQAVDREEDRDFSQAVMRLRRARDETQRLAEARKRGRARGEVRILKGRGAEG